jgi:hypothetical protein
MKIMYAHNENHFNLKYHFVKEYSRKKKLWVATKDFFQPRDVLNVINTPYIMFYFTSTYYYGLNKVQN